MDNSLDKLFDNTARVWLLKLFLMNPDGQFTTEEILKQTQLKRDAVRKELRKLVAFGLVKSRTIAMQNIKVKKLKKKPSRKSNRKTNRKKVGRRP